MIVIHENMQKALSTAMDPQANHYPLLYPSVLSLNKSHSDEIPKISQEVWLSLFQNSWNSVNTFFRLGEFALDKTNIFTAKASMENSKTGIYFSVEVDCCEGIMIFDCSKITEELRFKSISHNVLISKENMEKYKEQFAAALQKAERQFGLEFPSDDTLDKFTQKGASNNKKPNIVIIKQEIESKISNAFWGVLYSNGMSKYDSYEATHIKNLYTKANNIFPQYAQARREKKFAIFVKAYERYGSQRPKDSDDQSLYYEILKANLDCEVRIGSRLWTKVAEKRGRHVANELVLVNKNLAAFPCNDVNNIVYVLYENRGIVESFCVHELWSLLHVA